MDLFDLAATSFAISPERRFIVDLADSALQLTPTQPVWKWAEENVWLDEKMAATPGFYDSNKTPWAREWQNLLLQPEVREGIAMKSSQSGMTEGALNGLRWMPGHWPGNVLYAINSKEKASEVSDKRIHPTLARTAGAQITADPHDLATRKISLKNMEILVSGSGSSGPFMEAWYRLIILDELENHSQNQETTTYDRAKSRQATVPDGKLLAMSKPELAGGIIDLNYIRGTQEKWMVPCPHCNKRIELIWDYLRFNHCRGVLGWDLKRVRKETYYQCQCCGGEIHESHKREMVNAGEWQPTPEAERRRPPSGNVVEAEPGVRSFHISDLYSLWQNIDWGYLASFYVQHFLIEPNETKMKYFRTNHLGWPWEPKATSIKEDTINLLVAGIREDRGGVITQIGEPYELAYVDNVFHSKLPFNQRMHLTVSSDRQEHCIKYWVQAWTHDGQGFLIDLGAVKDGDDFLELRNRPYYLQGATEPMFIHGGLIDCGDEKMEMLRLCLKAWELGWELHPSRGSGFHSEFKGKTLFYRRDTVDGQEIFIREFYDHAVKNDFYLGKLTKRSDPRQWFPRNLPPSFIAELRAERLVSQIINGRMVSKWIHEKQKFGPNDMGDCGKQQWGIIFPEIKEALKVLAAPS
jgi:hypothetical protein